MKESFHTYVSKLSRKKEFYEYFGECVTESQKSKFENDDNYDFISEMLQSHNVDDLISKLKTLCGDSILTVEKEKGNKELDIFNLTFKDFNSFAKFQFDEKVKNALHYFNYFVTFAVKDTLTIYIEPSFSEKLTLEDYDKFHCRFFHVTQTAKVPLILARGLRCKSGLEGGYRFYPKRAYLLGIEDFKNKDKILKKFIEKTKPNVKNSCVVIEVEMNYSFAEVYKDLSMQDREDCYFVVTDIPKQCVKFYKNYNQL